LPYTGVVYNSYGFIERLIYSALVCYVVSEHPYKQFLPRLHDWEENPEPDIPELAGDIILDDNMEDVAWLYCINDESSQWLCYKGDLMELER